MALGAVILGTVGMPLPTGVLGVGHCLQVSRVDAPTMRAFRSTGACEVIGMALVVYLMPVWDWPVVGFV